MGRFDDAMFLIGDHTMIERTRMARPGVGTGQVTLLFRRRACAP